MGINMIVQVSGVLIHPTGEPIGNQLIRITSSINGDALKENVSEYSTDTNGNYDFTLVEGEHRLEILVSETYELVGTLEVNSATPNPIDLPTLVQYSYPVDPVNGVTYPIVWQQLFDALKNSSFLVERELRDQISDDLVHTVDIKSTESSAPNNTHRATDTRDLATCGAHINHEETVYCNEEGTRLASTGSVIETPSSKQTDQTTIDATGITTKHTSVSGGNSSVTTELVGAAVSNVKEITTPNTNQVDEVSHDGTSITEGVSSAVIDGNIKLSYTETGKVDSTPTDKIISKVLSVLADNGISTTEVNKYLNQTPESTEKGYDSTVNGKVTYDTHTNDGTQSVKKIGVDIFTVARVGNDLFEVDTTNDRVTIRGKLRITDIEDENGNPVIPEDGNTIFQVYQYSDAASGPWSGTLEPYHEWKRENWSVNGVIDPAGWSIAYRFKGSDGAPGDTIYEENQYSPDGSTNWTTLIKTGDKYKRTRLVTNGAAGPWSEPVRITGDDGNSGDTVEVRYEYSIDGIFDWHPTLSVLDRFERRATFINGVQDSPWTDPYPIGRGAAGRSVSLIGSAQGISYNTAGAIPNPSSVNLTANVFNTTGIVYYEWLINDVSVRNNTSNVYTYAAPTSFANTPVKFEVQIREGAATGNILARDQYTLYGIKAGENTITVILSNEAHTLPTTSEGVVTYTNSGTDISVYEGNVQLNYGTGNGNFTVSAIGSNVTVGGASTVSRKIRRYANHSNMTKDAAKVTYTVTVRKFDGTRVTLTKVQSLAKSNQGDTGIDGIVGQPGSGWYVLDNRGTGKFPSDAIATAEFTAAFGRAPTFNDHLTYVNNLTNATVSEIKRCNSAVGQPVTWSTPAMSINGDVIVSKTLSARHIVADSITGNEISSSATITAGTGSWTAGLNGKDNHTGAAASYNNWRMWAGSSYPKTAPFRVDKNGNMFAYSGQFRGKVELIGTNFMSLSSSDGFGTNNQFLEWTGPKSIDSAGNPVMSDVYESNAIKYFKTDGSAYFGGSFRAGTLSSSQSTSALISTPSTSIKFGSNGAPITIAASYSFSTVKRGATSGTPTETAICPSTPTMVVVTGTLFLEVKSGSSWVVVKQQAISGNYNCRDGEYVGPNYNIPYTSTSSSGSVFTYTDSTGSTANREYRARAVLNNFFYTNDTTQYVSITSTE